MSQSSNFDIIPAPAKLIPSDGQFVINAQTRIVAGNDLKEVANGLRDALRPATGFDLPISRTAGKNTIRLALTGRLKEIGNEGYRLFATPDGVTIEAPAPSGVFYGCQTLRQLLPAEIFRQAPIAGTSWTVPAVTIEDQPRFSWRGGHLDVGRHFMPKEFIRKFIDLLALHKLNTFHWHLTEDQGWRIEIKKYPKLTEIGAWRKDTMLTYSPPTYTGKPHGGFYSQEDVREIVAYAAARFVNVVPEIEMPGHAMAAIAAYPELGNPIRKVEVATKWGVFEDVYNVEDATIQFQKDVLAEVLDLFPSKFIHVGGDECPKTQWKADPKAQQRIKENGLKDEHELQSWFIRQIDDFLTAKGRRLVGWDEILEGGLAPGATVMSWRGMEGGIAAAKAGHDVVMAPNSHTYFDYYQSQDKAKEPHAIGGFIPLSKAYSLEPVPPALSAEEARHILGAQFQLWTEYMHNPKHVEYMMFPRACALAEVVWSPASARDEPGFLRRMRAHAKRLSALDVNFRKLE